MFEGKVTMHAYGWIPWVRAVTPDEVPAIAEDLADLRRGMRDEEAAGADAEYLLTFLDRAVEFVADVAATRRGFAYLIG